MSSIPHNESHHDFTADAIPNHYVIEWLLSILSQPTMAGVFYAKLLRPGTGKNLKPQGQSQSVMFHSSIPGYIPRAIHVRHLFV